MNEKSLKDLLPETLKPGLTPAEEKLLEAAQKGQEADLRSGREEEDNPEHSENWGPERTIRAEFLYWLCTDPEAGRRVHAKGIWIRGAKIAGPLDFTSATLPHPLLIQASALEDMTLAFAETRLLNFSGSSIHSISADGLSVKGSMFLREVKSRGEVRLLGANISGQLACDRAIFENPTGMAFNADGLSANMGILFNKVTAKGEVRFLGANIRGPFACEKAIFSNSGGNAFNADGLSVKGGLFLSEVTATGEVRLLGADIGGQLACNQATFENPEGKAFNGENLKVIQGLFFNMKKTTGRIDLMHANAGVLVDQEESWPEKGKLLLDGFEYGALGPKSPQTSKERLKWLRLQPEEFFSLQPYEQLAKVFRNSGRESDARAVLIAKQEDLREHGKLNRPTWLWNWFLGKTIGHGYQSERAILIIIIFWLIGSGFFYWADCLGVMRPTKENFFPSFNAFVYSLDAFIPFINLHQEDYWLPNVSVPYGGWFLCYFWFHIALGWLFSTLAALSLSGLIRKD